MNTDGITLFCEVSSMLLTASFVYEDPGGGGVCLRGQAVIFSPVCFSMEYNYCVVSVFVYKP